MDKWLIVLGTVGIVAFCVAQHIHDQRACDAASQVCQSGWKECLDRLDLTTAEADRCSQHLNRLSEECNHPCATP